MAESTQARIDQAIRDIVMGVFERAYRILDINRAVLERCARELLARVRAVLRRNQMVADAVESSDDDIPLICGDISMKIGQHEVMVRGENVFFPLKEFELLEYLMQNKGRVMTRHQLIDRIWGSDYVGDTKTLDVHVKRVRSKIEEDPAHPKYLTTVRGLGYKIDVPAE